MIVETTKTSHLQERPVRRVQIRDTDMSPDMQEEIIEIIHQGLDEYKLSKDVARYIKQQMDEAGGVWHVIVGSHYACNATHDAQTLINVLFDTTAVLAFRNGPPMKTD